MSTNTIVINMFGGPGAGKSTATAGLFNLMKQHGFKVELVTEYAKDLVYMDRGGCLDDQLYVTAKQNHRLHSLMGKVDYIVTDSPLLLGTLYAHESTPKSFNPFVHELFEQYDNFNFFINRTKEYQQVGRLQDEEGSDQKAIEIKSLLADSGYKFTEVDGNAKSQDTIFECLKSNLFLK